MVDPHARTRRSLVFVAADGDVVAARFLPLLRQAAAARFAVAVVTGEGGHRAAIEDVGARVVPLDIDSSGLNPLSSGYAAGQLSGMLKALDADIVHAVGLRAILLGGSAAAMAGIGARVYSPTDLGMPGDATGAGGRLSRLAVKALLRGPLASRSTRYLLDDANAAAALGLDASDVAVTIAEGAQARADAALRLYAELLHA